MDLVRKIQRIFSKLYLKYLVATELYMVETWEKIVILFLFATIFGLFWYLNYSMVSLIRTSPHVEQIL